MKRVLGILAVFCACLAAGTAPGRAQGWPANIRAIYDVNFNGFTVGSFEFVGQSEEESYSFTGTAQLTLFLGAFTWTGETRAFGLISNDAPKPAAFTFDFWANTKTGSTKVDFDNGAVTDVRHLPPSPAKAGTVPLREQHLKGVIDPLSAIMVLARVSNPNPCERRLPIFDGKERFDLAMTYKGQMKVSEQLPSGQPAMAHVCRVKYQPIAGHKVDAEHSYIATTDGIEVALRPIPSANMMVPYQITIPTLFGYATIVSKRVEIESPGRPQIALLH